MLKGIKVSGIVCVLALAGCHSGPNPLKVNPQKKVFSFLIKAGHAAENQLKFHPWGIGSIYRECMANPQHFRNGDAICEKVFSAMAKYGQTKTKDFSNVTVSDLKDPVYFKKISTPFTDFVFHLGQ